VLLDGVANAGLLEAVSDVPLDLHAHLPNVGHWLVRGSEDQVQSFLEEGLAMHRHAYLFEGVDCCDFEVEAGVLGDHVAESGYETRDPAHSVQFGVFGDSLDRHLSDRPHPVLQEVQDQRLEVFGEEVVVLSDRAVTCTLAARSQTFRIS